MIKEERDKEGTQGTEKIVTIIVECFKVRERVGSVDFMSWCYVRIGGGGILD